MECPELKANNNKMLKLFVLNGVLPSSISQLFPSFRSPVYFGRTLPAMGGHAGSAVGTRADGWCCYWESKGLSSRQGSGNPPRCGRMFASPQPVVLGTLAHSFMGLGRRVSEARSVSEGSALAVGSVVSWEGAEKMPPPAPSLPLSFPPLSLSLSLCPPSPAVWRYEDRRPAADAPGGGARQLPPRLCPDAGHAGLQNRLCPGHFARVALRVSSTPCPVPTQAPQWSGAPPCPPPVLEGRATGLLLHGRSEGSR